MDQWVKSIDVRDKCSAYEDFCRELLKDCEMSILMSIDDVMVGFDVRVLMDMSDDIGG